MSIIGKKVAAAGLGISPRNLPGTPRIRANHDNQGNELDKTRDIGVRNSEPPISEYEDRIAEIFAHAMFGFDGQKFYILDRVQPPE